jgi:large subunit ribosomal protein L9e
MLGKKALRVEIWFGKRDEISCLRTICTHIENMIKGVTLGYEYKMRFAYAHFPINVTVSKDGDKQFVEIRNFLGERKLRKVQMAPSCSVKKSDNVKDEITITGNSLELVSMSAANVHASCLIRNKDIRKFLDGLYVSERGPIGQTVSLM